jgi:F-type H+-transporting ATPase subunit a
LEKSQRKWRWGVNRWWILGFTILSILGVNLVAAPVQPHIQVAAEKLILEPVNLPLVGDLFITNTLPTMVLVDLVLIIIALIVRQALKKGEMVPTGFSGAVEYAIESLYNLTESTSGKYAKKIFPWFATIVLMVMVVNLIKLVPGFETIGIMHHAPGEGHPLASLGGIWYNLLPAKIEGAEAYILTPFFRALSEDLNFTLALALISVVMTQVIGVQAQGPAYFTKFFNYTTIFSKPIFGFIDFLVGLLETISEFAKILSFAFRLFGNMFAGFVLLALVGTMVPIFVPSMIMMFELFIGAIQAIVFGMLTMIFMTQATRGHGGEEHEEAH